MKIKYLFFVSLVCVTVSCYGNKKQNGSEEKQSAELSAFCGTEGDEYYTKFVEILNKQDTAEVASYIKKWEKAKGKTADIYVAWFNYYLLKKNYDPISISTDVPEGKGFALRDSVGKTVGYISESGMSTSENLNMAIKTLGEGIKNFPDRIDMAFGLIHTLLSYSQYDLAMKEVHRVLERSLVNKNIWKWSSDTPAQGKEDFLIECLHDYFTQLYEVQQDSLAMVLVDDVLAHYPDNVYFLNNKGALLANNGKEKEALAVFMKIHKINPTDDIVTSNIAYINMQLGNKGEARKYYKLLLNSEDEGIRADANAFLKELGE